MTNAQIQAYIDKNYKNKRASIRNKIKAVFAITNRSFTIRELAKKMDSSYKYLQPRKIGRASCRERV